MKKLWVNAVPYKKEIAIAALESGAEAVILPDGQSGTVREFGKIKTVEFEMAFLRYDKGLIQR